MPDDTFLLFADGGLFVVAGNVVPLDAVVVHVVEDGQALAASLGLRTTLSSGRPEADSLVDGLFPSVLPVQSAGVTTKGKFQICQLRPIADITPNQPEPTFGLSERTSTKRLFMVGGLYCIMFEDAKNVDGNPNPSGCCFIFSQY